MKMTTNILLSAVLLGFFSCSEPKKTNEVEVRPGAPLFPTAPASTQGGASANVNPPHGQPGHNCAFPVGAPLNATPAPSLNASPGAGLPGAPAPTPIQVAPGTNPPHGQPGHDCTIAVGAPLQAK